MKTEKSLGIIVPLLIIPKWEDDSRKQISNFHIGTLTDDIDIGYSTAEKPILMSEVLLLRYGSFTYLHYC